MLAALESILNTRLLGAAVIIALLVLFLPMFFSSSPPATSTGDQSVSLAIPPAPDGDLQTKTMSLTPGAATPAGAAAPTPATSAPAVSTVTTPGSGSQLATVNIASNRPRDVGTDAAAPQNQPPAPAAQPAAVPATQPIIPAQTRPAASATPVKERPQPAAVPVQQAPAQAAVPAQPALPAATAARGHYMINLSAYAPAGAQSLIGRVRALGYPANGRDIQRAGKSLTMVSAGPFDTRAAAEAARLKITQSIPGAPARLESGASTPQGDAPAAVPTTPASRPQAGGWAVQVAAMGSQADATALRDKLRANGFDGFVDSVNVGGKQLWRVRAGPQTQRSDALRIRDQIQAKLGVAGNLVTMP